MITKKLWMVLALVAVAGLSVFIAVRNSFVPGVQDVADPLGRPSSLSKEVIHSASEFDRLASGLVPKHRDLGSEIAVLGTVADNLDGLVTKAGGLGPLAVVLNKGTANVGDVARPLPTLIDKVTLRAKQAVPVAAGLGGAVTGVTTQLEGIGGGLQNIKGNLSALGPKAETIAATLQRIEAEAKRVEPLAPVLSLLSKLTNNGEILSGLTNNGAILPGLLGGTK